MEGDVATEMNSGDRMFFKFSGFAGMVFFLVILVFSYYVIFDARVDRSSLKVVFYVCCMLVLEFIILIKTFRMFTLVKKRVSDYITGFFLIFFQIYFLVSIVSFFAIIVLMIS